MIANPELLERLKLASDLITLSRRKEILSFEEQAAIARAAERVIHHTAISMRKSLAKAEKEYKEVEREMNDKSKTHTSDPLYMDAD